MESFISRQDRTEGFSTTGWSVVEDDTGTSINTMAATKAAVVGSCHYVTGFTVSFGKIGYQVMQDAASSYNGDNTGTSENGTYYHQWQLKDGTAIIQSGYCFNPCNFNFDFATPITITKGNAASIYMYAPYAISGEYALLTLRGFTVAE
tara:strand:- start:854 stop:1300 length:447 start_codon:yes stop_codon:yes gene_type:complete